MFFIIFAILNVDILTELLTQASEPSEDATALKKLLHTMNNTLLKFRANSNFRNLMYGELSEPALYDYPEVWWTERPPEMKPTETTVTTNINHSLSNSNKTARSPASSTFTLNASFTETLKPTAIKERIKLAKEIKRTNKYRKMTVTLASKATNTGTRETTKPKGKKYYIVNRDEAHGDLSIEDDGTNIRVDGRRNKTDSGMHAAVVSGLTLTNDTELSDFDYIIYDDRGNDDFNGDQNGTENKTKKPPVIIKILKPAEFNESLSYFKKGGRLLLGLDNSEILPKFVRDGLTRINDKSMTRSNATIQPKLANSFSPIENLPQNNSKMKENKSEVNLAQFFEALVSKHAKTNQPNETRPYLTSNTGITNVNGITIPFTPTFNPGTRFNYYKDPENFVREQFDLAKKNYEAYLKRVENSKALSLETSSQSGLDPLRALASTVAGSKDFNEASAISNVDRSALEHPNAMTRSDGIGPPGTSTTRPRFRKPPDILSPYVKGLIAMMREIHMGYFSVALIDLFDALAHKSVHDAGVLMKGYHKEVDTMLNTDHMFYLGKNLVDALQSFATYIMKSPSDVLQSQVKVLHNVMLDRRDTLTLDINSVVDFLDSMYTEDEGIALFKVMEKIRDYPKGKPTVIQLHRELTAAVYHPLITLKYAVKRKIALESINKIIENHLRPPPVGRRHIPKTGEDLKVITNKKHQPKNLNFGSENLYFEANHGSFNAYNLKSTSAIIRSKKETLKTTSKITNYAKMSKTIKTSDSNIRPSTIMASSYIRYGNKDIKQTLFVPRNMKNERTLVNLEIAKNTRRRRKHHKHRKLRKILKKLKKKRPETYEKYFKHKSKSHSRKSRKKKSKLNNYLQKYKKSEEVYEKNFNHHTAKKNLNLKHLGFDVRKKYNRTMKRELTSTMHLTTEKWLDIPIQLRGETRSAFGLHSELTSERDILMRKFLDFQDRPPKSKIRMQSSSNSDEEIELKARIYDALRHGNESYQYRRHHDVASPNVVNDTDSEINNFSSYSSEETVLKSKIYKGFLVDSRVGMHGTTHSSGRRFDRHLRLYR